MKFPAIVAILALCSVASASLLGLPLPLPAPISIGSTDPNQVQFFLYPNPDNTNDFDELKFNNTASVVASRYNPKNPIIVLSHGFTQNYTSQFPVYVRDAYLEAGFAATHNLVIVNWGNLSSAKGNVPIPVVSDLLALPVYVQAAANVYVVGKRVQEFLVFLEDSGFLESGGKGIHLVGQSLGAHVSGMAGHYYNETTGNLINRITGTDPALPAFEPALPSQRLDSSSAFFVDVVHTNQGEFGYLGNLGHVDFRINGGGPVQPDCGVANLTDFFCAHNLAPRFYAKSILDNSIMACPEFDLFCTDDDEIVFGEFGSFEARGSYELDLTL